MKVVAYMAQSLDGYIAGPNGELEWLERIDNPEGSDLGFANFMSTIDVLLMGKNTFEKVASFGFWPYDKPVYVASNTLKHLPVELEGKAHILSGDLPSMLSQLEDKGISVVYIDGGLLIQSALKHDFLNEITVTTLPVILGQGISLFGLSSDALKLQLKSSEVLLNQLVKTRYEIVVA
ncbi:MAG: dihydrofolate reductase family protein [Agarilytica sp.]